MTTPAQLPPSSPTPPACPPEEQLTAKLLGALSVAESATIDVHLATCDACREQAAELAKTVELLRSALTTPIVPEPALAFSRERLALVKAAQVASGAAALLPPARLQVTKKRAPQAPSAAKPPRAAWWRFPLPSAAARPAPKKPVSVTRRIVGFGVVGIMLALLWGLLLPIGVMPRSNVRFLGGELAQTKQALACEMDELRAMDLSKESDTITASLTDLPKQERQAEVDGDANLLDVAEYSTPLKLPGVYSARGARGGSGTAAPAPVAAPAAPVPVPAAEKPMEMSRELSRRLKPSDIRALRARKLRDSDKRMEPEVGFVAGTERQLAKGERAAQDAATFADAKDFSQALPDRQNELAEMVPTEQPASTTAPTSTTGAVSISSVSSSLRREEASGKKMKEAKADHEQALDEPVVALPPPVIYEIRPFVPTAQETFSTFGLDVDTASFTLARQALLAGGRPEPSSIRVEEFVNAFDYDYTPPAAGNRFAIHAESAPSPFRPSLELLKIGIKGAQLGRDHQQSAVLTVVLDGSGSMNTPDRLDLARQALKLLVAKLRPDDRLTLIQFNAQPRLLLGPTAAGEKEKILAALDSLQAGGATHLENGLKRGYEMAQSAFVAGAANRVLLLSDGVANLGAGDAQSLLAAVAENRKQGIYLSVFGLGEGAYNDALLEQLADKGDGTYVFLDSLAEAKRVLVDEFAATLFTIAKDVKIQVEFNPKRVVSWRQIGYDNRQLTKEQFRDDTVDAGEIGAGQAATALYELVLQGSAEEPLGVVRVRYHEVPDGMVREIQQTISSRERYARIEQAPPRFRLAAGVAEFAEWLRQSPYTQGSNPDELVRLLEGVGMEQRLDPAIRDLNLLAKRAIRQ